MSESTVHRIRFDVDHYQYLLYDRPDASLDMWLFNGTSRKETWNSAEPVYIEQPRLERPDIWRLMSAALIVLEPKNVSALEPFVSASGELLPLIITGSATEFVALNILRDVDCLEPGSFLPDDLRFVPNFVEHRLPESGLFKIPQTDTVDIFHVERDDDDDSFRARVEKQRLRGISFEEVWSTTSGPAHINLFTA